MVFEDNVNCKDCQHKQNNDAIKEMDDGVAWFCTLKHSECDNIVCLLRMIIWQLSAIQDDLDKSNIE